MKINTIEKREGIPIGSTIWDKSPRMDVLIAGLIADYFYTTLSIGYIEESNNYYVQTPTGFQALVGYINGKPAILHKELNLESRTIEILEFTQ